MKDNLRQHRVRAGETLWGIARRFGVTVGELLWANPRIKDPNCIRINQILIIPIHNGGTSELEERPEFTIHVVRPGETLRAITSKYKASLNSLLEANPNIKNPDLIYPGQKIKVPAAPESSPVPTPAASQSNDPHPEPSDPASSTSTIREAADPAITLIAGLNALLKAHQPTGASARTARQDKLPERGIVGVKASEAMAETDRERVMRHKWKFLEAARRFGLPPALLAGIASRESRGGGILDPNGFGDNGHGFGLMQIDDRNSFAVVHEGGPFGQEHINQAASILRDKYTAAMRKFPDLSDEELLQVAVSRYNGGRGLPPPDSDKGTTGGDYMNDVWARAIYYADVELWTDKALGSEELTESTEAFKSQPLCFAPAPSIEDVRNGNGVLQFAQEGEAVCYIQRLLGIKCDGDFGLNSRQAVISFQRHDTLKISPGAEGKVDVATLAALEKALQAAPHAGFDIDPRKKANNVHPELRARLALVADALVRRGMRAMITDGLRTLAEQDALYAIGRRGRAGEHRVTNAPAGLSSHNYGLAVDLYPVIDGKVFTCVPRGASQEFVRRFAEVQYAIGEEAERVGLTWGGRWKNPYDPPHVQLLGQKAFTAKECLAIYKARGSSLEAVWEEAGRRLESLA